jgi:hypothetical protein
MIAQDKVKLNVKAFKIQLYGGGDYDMFFDILYSHIWGIEASYKTHNLGLNAIEDFGVLTDKRLYYRDYKKYIVYYGYRVSCRPLSISLNVGAGTVSFDKLYFPSYETRHHNGKCIEFFLKTDFTGRANGLGFILLYNVNQFESIFDVRLVLQIGYQWNKKKKLKQN